MGFFSRSKDTSKRAAESLAARAFTTVTRISKAGDLDDVLRTIIESVKDLFHCENLSFSVLEQSVGIQQVTWQLEVLLGHNKGAKLSETECDLMPALKPGNFILSSDDAKDDVQLKCTAMAFRDNEIYGCQAFKGRISLHKDPSSENDLGDGQLLALAIPLTYDSHATLLSETIKLGVLTLQNVPLRDDYAELYRDIGLHVSQAIAFARNTYKDPLMGLRSESEIQHEVVRQKNLFDVSGGALEGGVVFGLVDSLTHYKKTIENEIDVSAATASQFVFDVLRGTGQSISARSMLMPLSDDRTYRGGVAGRFGTAGFVIALPCMKEDDMVRFARALQADVKEYNFPNEHLLEEGEITVSVRVMQFYQKGDGEMFWMKIRDEISVMYRDQSQARGTAKLKDYTATFAVQVDKRWLPFDEWKEHRKQVKAKALAAQKAAQAKKESQRMGPLSRPGGPPPGGRPPSRPGRKPTGRPGARPPSGPPGGRPSRPGGRPPPPGARRRRPGPPKGP